MQKKAILFSAGEYLDSLSYPRPSLDLHGVKYDIVATEKRLRQIGFDVAKKENCRKSEFLPALRQLTDRCPSDAIHIVYFSGHGGHCNGTNYIYPSDFAALYDKTKNMNEASINVEDIITAFKGKSRLILILDACRSDFGISKGYYSEMTWSENVYIAYGTMFKSASIATNGLSWFTEAICDEILTPNIDVDGLFTQVRKNIYTKYGAQLPVSVNGLLERIVLHTELDYDDKDKALYDFIENRGDAYNAEYGYFQGENLVFIDAAQYFDIGLLDAYWKYSKVQNKLAKEKGIEMPLLSEAEDKIITFLGFAKSSKRFSFDISHTWYYNGRLIRMGEIPPLPPSMQRQLPDQGKELNLIIKARREADSIIIETNLPDSCEIYVWDDISKVSKRYIVTHGKIVMDNANAIKKVEIESGVFASTMTEKVIIGEKCRNLVGDIIKYHPLYGNQIKCTFAI